MSSEAGIRTIDAPEPRETARTCGLAYVEADAPGLTRRRRGGGFSYHDASGSLIEDEDEKQRIAALAIPPAWTDVWICPDGRGHLQAVGTDAAGRRQYLYHEKFREARERSKFERLVPFGTRLPHLRRRVGRDLAADGLPRAKVAAAGVRMLDLAAIRVGNPEYERTNGTYGLTTLRRRHLSIGRGRALLRFDGKGGREIEIRIEDADLVRVLKECDEMPGYRVFQYVDEAGTKRALESTELNGYLQRVMAGPFTAKDFRMWAATTTAVTELAATELPREEPARRALIVEIAGKVGEVLHNTPAVARESYIHPCLEEMLLEGSLERRLRRAGERADQYRTPGRRREERTALALLSAYSD